MATRHALERVPGSKFITFLGTAIILIGIVALVIALTQ
jgi:hypothetical protein